MSSVIMNGKVDVIFRASIGGAELAQSTSKAWGRSLNRDLQETFVIHTMSQQMENLTPLRANRAKQNASWQVHLDQIYAKLLLEPDPNQFTYLRTLANLFKMKRALDTVNEKIVAALKRRKPDIIASDVAPRLIAVSKLKPITSILEAYECGQRYFGENYIQELETKSNSDEILNQCPEIKFHFIGHLQSNKVNKLLNVKNLHMIETIDSEKLADLINKAIDRHRKEGKQPLSFGDKYGKLQSDRLRVLIQVNTSDEEQKNGVQPHDVNKLADHIVQQCQWLRLAGLMTIGKLGGWEESGPNKDFLKLYEVRDSLSKHLSVAPCDLELSMGMSSDFEEAIELGSTNVRVGTMIFGERPPKNSE